MHAVTGTPIVFALVVDMPEIYQYKVNTYVTINTNVIVMFMFSIKDGAVIASPTKI